MSIRSKLFLPAVLFSALAISTFAVCFVVTAQVTPADYALQTAEKAYTELKAAEAAGANITTLAVQFNAALGLLQNSSRYEEAGDNATASALASQAENSFLSIIPAAESLRDAAISKRQQEATLRYNSIPIGALIVAVASVAALLIYHRIQRRQFMELKIKAKMGE